MQVNWEHQSGHTIICRLGSLYVGCVMRIVPERWREWEHNNEALPPDAPEYMRVNREHRIKQYTKMEATPWRAWIMRDEDGEPYGYFATAEMAKERLEQAVRDDAARQPE